MRTRGSIPGSVGFAATAVAMTLGVFGVAIAGPAGGSCYYSGGFRGGYYGYCSYGQACGRWRGSWGILGLNVSVPILPWGYETLWGWDDMHHVYPASGLYVWVGDAGEYQIVEPPSALSQAAPPNSLPAWRDPTQAQHDITSDATQKRQDYARGVSLSRRAQLQCEIGRDVWSVLPLAQVRPVRWHWWMRTSLDDRYRILRFWRNAESAQGQANGKG